MAQIEHNLERGGAKPSGEYVKLTGQAIGNWQLATDKAYNVSLYSFAFSFPCAIYKKGKEKLKMFPTEFATLFIFISEL